METSILKTIKKILGLAEDYTIFDLDLITHINSAFSNLRQLGINIPNTAMLENEEVTWETLELPPEQLNMVKTYIYLKSRLIFDPPGTSYLITAIEQQIREHEWRLNVFHEEELMNARLITGEVT